MGGKEGARGYLYQAMVALLESIKNHEWGKVMVEPNTKEDKIDIIFEYKENKYKCIQVKSSINNFVIKDILSWFNLMIRDKKDSDEYSLILIGTYASDTKKKINIINKLRNSYWDNETSEYAQKLESNEASIYEVKEKLIIQSLNEDIEGLESNLCNNFADFLEQNGYIIERDIIKVIVSAITNDYNIISTNSKYITRKDFIDKIIKYADRVTSMNKRMDEVEMKVEFYKNYMFYEEYKFKELIDISKSQNIISKKMELKKLIEEIKLCKLEEVLKEPSIKYTENKRNSNISEDDKKKIRQLNMLMEKIDFNMLNNSFMYKNCEYDEEEKKEISESAKRLLEVEISQQFFEVGDLKKESITAYNPLFKQKPKYIGGESNIKKYEKMEKLIDGLNDLKHISDMFDFINKYYSLPIILQNVGEYYDEKIRVQLQVPKDVEVLSFENIKYPYFTVIDYFIGQDSLFNNLLRIKSDGRVIEYLQRFNKHFEINNPFEAVNDVINRERSNYIEDVKNLFNCKIYENDYKIIEYEFDELKPNESIAFPTYLFLKCNSNIDIKYRITSKNIKIEKNGVLRFVIQ